MPEQKTPNQNFPRLTMQQAKEEMACFQKIYPLTGHIGKDEQVRHNLSTYYYHFFALRRGFMTEKLNGTTETVDFDVSSSVRFSTALAYCLGDHLPH